MAGDRQGKCVNIGNCNLADKHELITTKPGQDFVCPECGKGLVLATTSAGHAPARGGTALRAGAGVVLALVAGGLAVRSCAHRGEPGDAPGIASPNSVTAAGGGEPALRLGGSNTIGAKLGPALVTAYFKERGCADVKTTTPAAEETVLTCDAGGRTLAATASAHGSSSAFEGLAAKAVDVGMASRKVKADEADKLTALGDMTAPSNEHVLGLDGIAVIVHPGNRVSSLTVDQVGAIFTGVVTDWKQVGGTPGRIDVYARDDKSGTYDTFKTLLLDKTPLVPSAKRYEESAELSSQVANDPNGIGFVGLSSVASAKAVAVGPAGAAPLVPPSPPRITRSRDGSSSTPPHRTPSRMWRGSSTSPRRRAGRPSSSRPGSSRSRSAKNTRPRPRGRPPRTTRSSRPRCASRSTSASAPGLPSWTTAGSRTSTASRSSSPRRPSPRTASCCWGSRTAAGVTNATRRCLKSAGGRVGVGPTRRHARNNPRLRQGHPHRG